MWANHHSWFPEWKISLQGLGAPWTGTGWMYTEERIYVLFVLLYYTEVIFTILINLFSLHMSYYKLYLCSV